MAKATIFFLATILVSLVILPFAFVFIKSLKKHRSKAAFISSFLGGLIIVLSFIGFGTMRQQIYQIFAGQNITDQYVMLTYYASLEKDCALMNHYYNKYDDVGLYFMESMYLGSVVYCNYDSAQAVTNFNILRHLLDNENIASISQEVFKLNLIKVAALIQIHEQNSSYLNSVEGIIEESKRFKSKYFKIMKSQDPILQNIY